ncbi:hypothetical protein EC988_004738, partial [Linderina pennispora]
MNDTGIHHDNLTLVPMALQTSAHSRSASQYSGMASEPYASERATDDATQDLWMATLAHVESDGSYAEVRHGSAAARESWAMATPELSEAVHEFPQPRGSCDGSGSVAHRRPQQTAQQYKRNGSFSMALLQNHMSASFSEEEADQEEVEYLFDDQAGASPIATPTVAWQRISQGNGAEDGMQGIRRGSVLATTISAPVSMRLPENDGYAYGNNARRGQGGVLSVYDPVTA